MKIRAFEDSDYERLAEIQTAIDPESSASAFLLRERDAVDEPRVRMLHLAAESPDGVVVGAGRVMHVWFNFHPRKFILRIEVNPPWQRRGVGSSLFDRLMGQLHDWDAELVRSETRDGRVESIAFLEHRGFREWRRRWESILDVSSAGTAALRAADSRVTDAGITLTTYDAAQVGRRDQLAHDVWLLEDIIFRADRDNPEGEGMSFERFRATELEWSGALPDGHFLAFAGDRLVGVSRLVRDRDRPGKLDQSFTGTHPDFRGRGIAQALKLRGIEYARQHGYKHIRTSNDSTNEPMLHINQSIGFRRGPTIIVFERRLSSD